MPRRLREAHAHLAAHGRSLRQAALHECDSHASFLDAMARAAQAAAPSEWVIGVGARPESWTERCWPSLDEFDQAVGGKAAIAWCFDFHALLASSQALGAAKISASSGLPRGVIGKDNAGRLTGLVMEAAAHAVWASVPEPSPPQRREDLRRALADLAGHGFTEVHDLLSEPWLGDELAAIDEASGLPLDVVLYPRLEHLEEVRASRGRWERRQIRLGGVKLFADGTLNSRTAWMLHDYADPISEHPRGKAMVTEAELAAAVSQADDAGLPLATHAIGDAAVRAVLDAIELVQPRTSGFRIEHAEIIDEADVNRFKRLNVICSVQPCHLLYDGEVLHRTLPHRLERVLPLRELIDSGLRPGTDLLFGSDTPIVRPHPQDSIDAAVRRTIAPNQAITLDEAWACFA